MHIVHCHQISIHTLLLHVFLTTFRWKETPEIEIGDWDWTTLQMQKNLLVVCSRCFFASTWYFSSLIKGFRTQCKPGPSGTSSTSSKQTFGSVDIRKIIQCQIHQMITHLRDHLISLPVLQVRVLHSKTYSFFQTSRIKMGGRFHQSAVFRGSYVL